MLLYIAILLQVQFFPNLNDPRNYFFLEYFAENVLGDASLLTNCAALKMLFNLSQSSFLILKKATKYLTEVAYAYVKMYMKCFSTVSGNQKILSIFYYYIIIFSIRRDRIVQWMTMDYGARLNSNPNSDTYYLCDFGQVIETSCPQFSYLKNGGSVGII